MEDMTEATAVGLSWYNQPLTTELELEDAEYTRVGDQYDSDYEVLGESTHVNHGALRTNLSENVELPHSSQRSGHEDDESHVTVSPSPPRPLLDYSQVPTQLPPRLYTLSSVGVAQVTERQLYAQSSFWWAEGNYSQADEAAFHSQATQENCDTLAVLGALDATAIQLPIDSQQWRRRPIEGGSPPQAKRLRFGKQ